MQDIVKAMEREETYLSHRMKGEEPFHLIDAVKECGFDTLEAYFEAKREYLFGNLDFHLVEQPMPGGVAEIFKMIQANVPGALFVDWEDTYVVSGTQGLATFNREYCEENGITVFDLQTGGGTIVGSEGDFSLGVCYPMAACDDQRVILNHVKDILQRHTDKIISVDGNDILADGNKISGTATYRGADVLMTILHFSFADWSELISAICTTTKVGKTVSYVDFVSRAEFKQEVMEWLRLK